MTGQCSSSYASEETTLTHVDDRIMCNYAHYIIIWWHVKYNKQKIQFGQFSVIHAARICDRKQIFAAYFPMQNVQIFEKVNRRAENFRNCILN